ncbi:MAG: hypothetical protein F6K47_34540 [Symploca sp. SIO2E6]|nr:hypothetical protein [Symploca sp. SIO2E6]
MPSQNNKQDLIIKNKYLEVLYQQFEASYERLGQVTGAEAARVQTEIDDLQAKINSLQQEIYRNTQNRQTPFEQVTSEELFNRGTELIIHAKKRVALVAKTPIPLVGTRPYGENLESYPYEVQQFNAIKTTILKAVSGELIFRCVASTTALCQDLQNENSFIFKNEVKKNINHLYNSMEQENSFLHIGWHDDLSPMTYLVADNYFLLWFKDSDDKFCLSVEDYHVANALWSLAKTKSREINREELLKKIRIN